MLIREAANTNILSKLEVGSHVIRQGCFWERDCVNWKAGLHFVLPCFSGCCKQPEGSLAFLACFSLVLYQHRAREMVSQCPGNKGWAVGTHLLLLLSLAANNVKQDLYHVWKCPPPPNTLCLLNNCCGELRAQARALSDPIACNYMRDNWVVIEVNCHWW